MRAAVLTNGPGELWGWARPVIKELHSRGHHVTLWLLPCQFASGHERDVAALLGADEVIGPYSSARTLLAMKKARPDCVLQLGGDLFFGRSLAKRAGAPLFCYSYGSKSGMRHARMFTAYRQMAAKMPDTQVIGDIVKDSLQMDADDFQWPEHDCPRLLLFPGSRPAIRAVSKEWMMEIVERLRKMLPNLHYRTLFSRFVPREEQQEWRQAGLNPVAASAASAMQHADYAITQPGTNTLEMMHCGLPALVAAPLDFLSVVPVGGLGHFTAALPWLGDRIKIHVIKKILNRYTWFTSWPNRLAGRPLMDELTGDVTARDIAETAASAMSDANKLRAVRNAMLSLSGTAGAAARLCNAMEEEEQERG